MKTINSVIRDATLKRLREFRGHRRKTCESLGISMRTLQMWLQKWSKEGLFAGEEDFDLWYSIVAKRDCVTGQAPNEQVIKAGAIGSLMAGIYYFDVAQIEPRDIDPATKSISFDAKELMSKYEDFFDIAHETLKSKMVRTDLSHIETRIYKWTDTYCKAHEYVFENPVAVIAKPDDRYHFVIESDGKTVTCVPAPGEYGCIMSQLAKEGQEVVRC